MKALWRLSFSAVIVAYGAVMLGSWTRINGAGMTCPDWPRCDGLLVPPLGNGTIWEWTHRLLVFVLSPLVLAVIIAAWRQRRCVRFIAPTMWAVGILFAFQVFLGAATVRLANSPISVVWHWGTAMAFIASLCAMAIFARTALDDTIGSPRREPVRTALTGVLGATMLIAFATMCVGAYVSSSGAGLACLTVPGCAGSVVVYSPGQYVQMLHRFVAAACLLSGVASFALAWAWRASLRVRVMATIGLLLIFVQVLLGLLNVALRLPIDLREAHAANAALVFLAFVMAVTFAALDTVVSIEPATV
ncbi:MAG TPA: COX15/CtaA family protein [Candidatus Baltobacteraceae bacterium]